MKPVLFGKRNGFAVPLLTSLVLFCSLLFSSAPVQAQIEVKACDTFTVANLGGLQTSPVYRNYNYGDTVPIIIDTMVNSVSYKIILFAHDRRFMSVRGCDSAKVSWVTVNPVKDTWFKSRDNTPTSIFLLDTAGLFPLPRRGFNCQTIVHYKIQIKNTRRGERYVASCNSWRWGDGADVRYGGAGGDGQIKTDDADLVKTWGDADDSTNYLNDCDTIETVHLRVHHPNGTIIDTVCDSTRWDGRVNHWKLYTATQDINDTLRSRYKQYKADSAYRPSPVAQAPYPPVICDSNYVLRLVVHYPSDSVTPFITGCDSAQWFSGNGVRHFRYRHADSTNLSEITVDTIGPNYYGGGRNLLNVNGCDSTIYVRLAVQHSITVVDSVAACDSFQWGGVRYPLTMFRNDVTLDSNVRDTMARTIFDTRLNLPNNCDSLVALYLEINHPRYDTVSITACDHYSWQGQNFTNTTDNTIFGVLNGDGNYPYADLSSPMAIFGPGHDSRLIADTCGTHRSLNLTLDLSRTTPVPHLACDSFSWWNHSQVWTTFYPPLENVLTGYSEYPLHTVVGNCDSLGQFHLSVHSSTSHEFVQDTNAVICGIFSWHGVTYTSSTTVRHPYVNAQGCDSIVTLDLTVFPGDTTIIQKPVCDGDSITVHIADYDYFGVQIASHRDTFYHDTLVLMGRYPHHSENVCDSLVYWNITFSNNKYDTLADTVCDYFVWSHRPFRGNMRVVRDSVAFTPDTLLMSFDKTARNCDSVTAIRLVVNHRQYADSLLFGCDYLRWRTPLGDILRTDSTSDYTFPVNVQAQNGCDSLLRVRVLLDTQITVYDTFTGCNPYTPAWAARPLTQSLDTMIQLQRARNYLCDTAQACDSFVYRHVSVVHTPAPVQTNLRVCDSLRYLRVDSTWRTFTRSTVISDTLMSHYGCDSVVNLILTVKHSSCDTVTTRACDSYLWKGRVYRESTDDTVTSPGINHEGCDSSSILHLTIIAHTTDDVDTTACGDFLWHTFDREGNAHATHFLNTTGTFRDTVIDGNGCDSVLTLNLTINYIARSTDVQTPCDSLHGWHNMPTFFTDTVVVDTMHTLAGCDSIVTLNLALRHTTFRYDSVFNQCDSFHWSRNNITYYHRVMGADATYPEETPRRTNLVGCDSVVRLYLSLYYSATDTNVAEACGSYTWHGRTFTQDVSSGIHQPDPHFDTLTTHGCDSTIYLHLTIHAASEPTDTFAGSYCAAFYWHDSIYHPNLAATLPDTVRDGNGNLPSYTYTNIHGCDSVVRLHVLVLPNDTVNETASVCDRYTWRGNTYDTTGIYYEVVRASSDSICDSTHVLHLNVRYSSVRHQNELACNSFQWYKPYGSSQRDSLYTASTDTIRWRPRTQDQRPLSNYVGCDTLIQLHLTIVSDTLDTVQAHGCGQYYWDWSGRSYFQSGQIADTHDVRVHLGQLDTLVHCHHIRLLDLVIHQNDTVWDTVTTCDHFTWALPNNHILNFRTSATRPVYLDTVTWDGVTMNPNWCERRNGLHLTLKPHTAAIQNIEACDRYYWTPNQVTYYESTTQPTVTLNNANAYGCDSTLTLNLTVRNGGRGVFEVTACNSYRWLTEIEPGLFLGDGREYSEEIEQNGPTDTLPGSYGCDSIVELRLHMRGNFVKADTLLVCDGYTWDRTGLFYDTTGIYIDTVVRADAVTGCDSLYILNLTVVRTRHSMTDTVACDNFVWNTPFHPAELFRASVVNPLVHIYDTVYSTYYDEVICTNTDSLLLQMYYSNAAIDDRGIVCDSLRWNGVLYTESTTDSVFVTRNVGGCDSTVTLHLTINHSYVEVEDSIVCGEYFEYPHGSGIRYYSDQYIDRRRIHGYTQDGCDYVDQNHIILHPVYSGNTMNVVTATACDSFEWQGNIYRSTTSAPVYRTQSVVGGCDSVVNLHLTINRSSWGTSAVEACDQYVFGNETYTESALTQKLMPDSNMYGCDSVLYLNLTIYHSQTTVEEHTGCDSLRWNGTLYTSSTNQPLVTLHDIHGCDSTVALHLTLNRSVDTVRRVQACDSFRFDGTTYLPGVYQVNHHAFTPLQCDSNLVVYITIYPSNTPENTLVVSHACDSFVWERYNMTFYEDTVCVTDRQTNRYGCDSSARLVLRVFHSSSADVFSRRERCDNYTWHGNFFTSDTICRMPLVGMTNSQGCDTVETLHLTLRYASYYDTYDAACDIYSWDGESYRIYGTDTIIQRQIGNNIDGCPSIDRRLVTVYHASEETFANNACGAYLWNDSLYTTSGDYTQAFTSIHGCDSIVTLHLTVRATDTIRDTVRACDSYVWRPNGRAYYQTCVDTLSTLRQNGCYDFHVLNLAIEHNVSTVERRSVCDSVVVSGRGIFRRDTVIRNLQYTSSYGCDSNVTLYLHVLRSSSGMTTATSCNSYQWWDSVYTASTSAVHIDRNKVGCDSVMRLDLVIHYDDTINVDTIACDSLYWHGNRYYVNRQDVFHGVNGYGCDRVEFLNLTVRHATTSHLPAISTCDSLLWHDSVYRASTRARYTMANRRGCDSTIFVDLTVRHSSVVTLDPVDACGAYRWEGHEFRQSTPAASIVLAIPNIEGCDSVLSRAVTIWPEGLYRDTVYACEQYFWPSTGLTYYESTVTQPQMLRSAHGCDSLVSMDVRIGSGSSSTMARLSACDTLRIGERVFTESVPEYQIDLHDIYGCDSIVLAQITINHTTYAFQPVVACDTFLWNDSVYRASTRGLVHHVGRNTQGCDSILNVDLTLRHRSDSTVHVSQCDGYLWTDGITYTESQTLVNRGQNRFGCDSVFTLHLTVNGHYSYEHQGGCSPFAWGGGVYYHNDTIANRMATPSGCDTVHVIYITVQQSPERHDTVTACNEYRWAYRPNVHYTANIDDTVHRSVSLGCDSIITLHLTLHRDTATEFSLFTTSDYDWEGEICPATGTYQQHFTTVEGCDSLVTLHLTRSHVIAPTILNQGNRMLVVNHFPAGETGEAVYYSEYRWYCNHTLIPNANEDYYVAPSGHELVGCYYVEVPVDGVEDMWVASNTICINYQGIDDVEASDLAVKVYPNPVMKGGLLRVSIDGIVEQEGPLTVTVYDLQGRAVSTTNVGSTVEAQQLNIPVTFPAGIYTLQLSNAAKRVAACKVIVK